MSTDAERDPWEADKLSIERPDEGLYLHRASPERKMPGTRVTTLVDPDGTERYLVDAEQFMELQKERDDYRRVAGLINAWRLTPCRSETALQKLLAELGLDDRDARAMLDIIAQFRPGALG